MLIDCSYFVSPPRHIQNATLGSAPNQNAIEVRKAIEGYIQHHQYPFLLKILGRTVGNKVNAYLVCKDEGDELNDEGFEKVCKVIRESFADYVFFHILRDGNTQATLTGLVRLKTPNTYIPPITRQTSVWNSMVERNREFAAWSQSDECTVRGISIDNDLLTPINAFNL